MKRSALLLAVALLLLLSSSPSAWCRGNGSPLPKGELNISYGLFNVGEFVMTFGQVLAMGLSLGNYSVKNLYFTGAFAVEGYFKASDWLYAGAIVGYEHMGGDQYNKSGTVTHDNGSSEALYEYKGKAGIDMIMPMLSLKPFWFNRETVSMYSKIAGGAFCLLPGGDDSGSVSFGFQLSPVCIEFGRSWRGFAELGFGMQGILNAGISKRF